MIYLEYEMYKIKYAESQEQFNMILTEKERLFTKTLPIAIRYDKDKVQSSPTGNMLEDYIIAMDDEQINERLSQLRQLLSDRSMLLQLKENELRQSRDIPDRVYVHRFIDGHGINRIAKDLNYSKSQIYRILGQIRKRCDKMRKKLC